MQESILIQRTVFQEEKFAPTFHIDIWIAGNFEDAQRVCRRMCMADPFCVTVRPVEYIYTGGQEAGVVVSIINYPRFPRTPEELRAKAFNITSALMVELCQESATIEMTNETVMVSNRPRGESPSKRS